VFGTLNSPALWIGFTVFVVILLILDLTVFHRGAHVIGPKEAAIWSAIWIALALVFGAGMYIFAGPERGTEYITGYLIEKTLSVDNLFVFLIIFTYFAVPNEYRYNVLFWGILAAIVLRGAFILVGAALLATFHWMIFVFGGFLIYTGFRILIKGDEETDPERNFAVRLFRKVLPSTANYHGGSYIIKLDGRWLATPLLLVLLVINVTDVVFALDSVPAIFAITREPFIVYSSNIFAILGLRALYFLLADLMGRFHYLGVGLGLVLVFVGVKMVVGDFHDVPKGDHFLTPVLKGIETVASSFHEQPVYSLAVVGVLLGGSIIASLLRPVDDE
jgi:tellurite resistance protein TerC